MLDLWRNLPGAWLARILRALTFPTGLCFRGPDDALDHAAARLLLEPGAVRNRLTAGIFHTRDPAFPSGRLELALETSVRAEEIRRILRKAAQLGRIGSTSGPQALRDAVDSGVLRPDEIALLHRAEQLRDRVTQVDSFADLTRLHIGAVPAKADRHKSAA